MTDSGAVSVHRAGGSVSWTAERASHSITAYLQR